MQFTIEEFNPNSRLAFLDLNVKVDSGKKVICKWYQKPTDTGIIKNFRGCAPLQYKRNVIEATVHKVFRSTSTWEHFDQALEKKIENQYPKNWSDRVVYETLTRSLRERKILHVTASEQRNDKWLKDSSPFS